MIYHNQPFVKATEDEFWACIGNKNVHPRIVGGFPYTSVFETPLRTIHGVIIDRLPRNNGIPVREHFIPSA